MTEQLSIFDFLGEFATMPEEEMVEILGMKLGIKFTPEVLPKGTWRSCPAYEYKRKGLKLEVYCCTDIDDKTFISAGWSKGTSGGGGPYYSIEEAASYFKKVLERYG